MVHIIPLWLNWQADLFLASSLKYFPKFLFCQGRGKEMAQGNGIGLLFSGFIFLSLNPFLKNFVGPQQTILCHPMAVVSVYKILNLVQPELSNFFV